MLAKFGNVLIRVPIGFGIYRIEPIGFSFGSVNIDRITEPKLSVNNRSVSVIPVSVSVSDINRTDLPKCQNYLAFC